MFTKQEINKFDGFNSELAPELLKDENGTARDILNLRGEKIGKLETRDGYRVAVYADTSPTANVPKNIQTMFYIKNGGIIGLGEFQLSHPPLRFNGATKFMVYYVRGVSTLEPAGSGASDSTDELLFPQVANTTRNNRDVAKEHLACFLFVPINGLSANSHSLIQAYDMFEFDGVTGNICDMEPHGDYNKFKHLFAPNRDLTDNMANTSNNLCHVVKGSMDMFSKDAEDPYIQKYVTMNQYRNKLIVSDKINGDMAIENTWDLDSTELELDRKDSIRIRANCLDQFDIDCIALDDRLKPGQENDVVKGVETGMALYQFELEKETMKMTNPLDKGDAVDKKNWGFTEKSPLDSSGSTYPDPDYVASQFFSLSENVMMAGVTYGCNSYIRVLKSQRYFSNADTSSEYRDLLGKLKLSEVKYYDEKKDKTVKTLASNAYVWEDMQLKYFPIKGIDGYGYYLNGKNRLSSQDNGTAARAVELAELDDFGSKAPLGGWRYRFVWDFGEGVYSAPSTEILCPDIMWSATTDSDIPDIKDRALYGKDVDGIKGYHRTSGFKFSEFYPEDRFKLNQKLSDTMCLYDSSYKLTRMGKAVYDIKKKLYDGCQTRYGLNDSKGYTSDGELIYSNSYVWKSYNYGDFFSSVMLKSPEHSVEMKGVIAEFGAIHGDDNNNLTRAGNGDYYISKFYLTNGTGWVDTSSNAAFAMFKLVVPTFPYETNVEGYTEFERFALMQGIFDKHGRYRASWETPYHAIKKIILMPSYTLTRNAKHDSYLSDSRSVYYKDDNFIYGGTLYNYKSNHSNKFYLNIIGGMNSSDLYMTDVQNINTLVKKDGTTKDFTDYKPETILRAYSSDLDSPDLFNSDVPQEVASRILLPGTAELKVVSESDKLPFITTKRIASIDQDVKLMDLLTKEYDDKQGEEYGYTQYGWLKPVETIYEMIDAIDVDLLMYNRPAQWGDVHNLEVVEGEKYWIKSDNSSPLPDSYYEDNPQESHIEWSWGAHNALTDRHACYRLIVMVTSDSQAEKNGLYYAYSLRLNGMNVLTFANDTRLPNVSYKDFNTIKIKCVKYAQKDNGVQPVNYTKVISCSAPGNSFDDGIFCTTIEADGSLAGTSKALYKSTDSDGMKTEVSVYLPGHRSTLLEQLYAVFPSSVLHKAPRMGIKIPGDVVPSKAKRLLIFRTLNSTSNEYQPNTYGLVDTIDIERASAKEVDNVNKHMETEYSIGNSNAMPIKQRLKLNHAITRTYKYSDGTGGSQDDYYDGIYFFDDKRDTVLNFTDGPDNYEGLRYPLKSAFNFMLNERAYYANFIQQYQPEKPRGFKHPLQVSNNPDNTVSVNNIYYITGISKDKGILKTDGSPAKYVQYLYLYEDGMGIKSQPTLTPIIDLNTNDVDGDATGNRRICLYFTPSGYSGGIKYLKVYRKIFDTIDGLTELQKKSDFYCIKSIETDPDIQGVFVDDGLPIGELMRTIDVQRGESSSIEFNTPPNTQDYESGVMWSEPYNPDWIKMENFIEFGSGNGGQITGLTAQYGNLTVFKESAIYRAAVQTDNPPISRVDAVSVNTGCIAPNSLANVMDTLYFLSNSGFMMYDNNVIKPVDSTFNRELMFLLANNKQIAHEASVGYNRHFGEIYLNVPRVSPKETPKAIAKMEYPNTTATFVDEILPYTKYVYSNRNNENYMDTELSDGNAVKEQLTNDSNGHVFVINIKNGTYSKFGYPATIYRKDNGVFSNLITNPLHLVRKYYTNSDGVLVSADIVPHWYDVPSTGLVDTAECKSLFWAGLYFESPIPGPSAMPIMVESANSTAKLKWSNTEPFSEYDIVMNAEASHKLMTTGDSDYKVDYPLKTLFPKVSPVEIDVVWKSKLFTGETETVLKRIRSVSMNVFSKFPIKIVYCVLPNHSIDSGITCDSACDVNSVGGFKQDKLMYVKCEYNYPPTLSSYNHWNDTVTKGSFDNLLTFIPDSNYSISTNYGELTPGNDDVGKAIKFGVELYSRGRVRLNALTYYLRHIWSYLR